MSDEGWLLIPEVVVVVVAVEGNEAERVGDRVRFTSYVGPMSKSGNVIKNKQPNVVPKKAPSTE